MSIAKLSEIPLVPLTNKKFEELRNRADVRQKAGGTPELGDKYTESPTYTQAYTGCCDQFDLSDPTQRKLYGELVSKLYSGAEYIKLWEEKLPGSNGSFFVYISYLKVMTVYQTGNDLFDLKEGNND